MRSEEPGLGSEASGTRGPGLLWQWSRLAGARQWPGAGGGEEWTLDSLRRCGECGHWLLSVSLCSMPGWGGGWSQCHYHGAISHHLAVYSVSVRSPEYRGILLASGCQVSLSAFLISESAWVIGVRWADVGSGICYHYALCQTGTRPSQIQNPRHCRYRAEGGGLHIYKYMRIMRKLLHYTTVSSN